MPSASGYEEVTEQHPFPTTRYMGSKRKIADWIVSALRELDFGTALDAFGGTGSVSHAMKRMGKSVTYNDILVSNSVMARAIIQNGSVTLSDDGIDRLMDLPDSHPTFIEDTFSGIYYTDEEDRWLDGFMANLGSMEDGYGKDIAMFGLFQACICKRPLNLFHRANLNMRTSDYRKRPGNRTTWDTPFPVMVRRYIGEANRAVFDSGRPCRSICGDAMGIEGSYDLVYIDTPYIDYKGDAADYMDYYQFLEGLADYDGWADRIDVRYRHKPIRDGRCKMFTDKRTVERDFDRLFGRFGDSTLVVSYRSDGTPSIDRLKGILESYKDRVEVRIHPYRYGFSNRRSDEVLLIARRRFSAPPRRRTPGPDSRGIPGERPRPHRPRRPSPRACRTGGRRRGCRRLRRACRSPARSRGSHRSLSRACGTRRRRRCAPGRRPPRPAPGRGRRRAPLCRS